MSINPQNFNEDDELDLEDKTDEEESDEENPAGWGMATDDSDDDSDYN